MSKFKPFYEFQKPLIGLSPESFLDYINGVIPEDELYRKLGQRPFYCKQQKFTDLVQKVEN